MQNSKNIISYINLLKIWLKIGLLSFGGPAAQIALIHREIVEGKKWLHEKDFLNALSFCILLPGPEAMQLATYAGWRSHGIWGGIISGLLFVLPGAIIMMGLAAIYSFWGQIEIIALMFSGIKAAVIIIVVQALLRITNKTLKSFKSWCISLFSFIAIFFLSLPYILIVILAGLFGLVFLKEENTPSQESTSSNADTSPDTSPDTSIGRFIKTIAIGLVIWWLPITILYLFGADELLFRIGLFFSKLAVVTFGGAYAVLAYIGQAAEVELGGLGIAQVMDALALAESTPGPLILVTEFVGFLSGFHKGGLLLGISGALVTLWVTFIPCFLWIFAGAPYIEWMTNQSKIKSALSGIMAAAVGIIFNLTLWFTLHAFFTNIEKTNYGWLTFQIPDLASTDYFVIGLSALCCLLLIKFKWGIVTTLIASSLLGMTQIIWQ